jgi:hypothetical protein
MEAAKKPTPIAINTTSSMAITYEFLPSRARPTAPNPSQDQLACIKCTSAR